MSVVEAVFGALACAGLGALEHRRLARTSGALRLPGLERPVEVIRDEWGVPHIYAESTHDLMFAQGFVHAQDRLWQMDFQRRLAAGRLAEVLGERALPADRWLRILGMRRVAEVEAATLPPDVRPTFEAYAAGVNAFIASEPLPVEFVLLHYRPEPWAPVDTLTWTKMLAWSLAVNWESELLRAQLIARLGPEMAAELEPDCSDLGPCVMSPGVDYAALGRTAQQWVAEARSFVGPPAQDGLGSNAWVIAGSRTATGRPLLANDLHQMMGTPCVWYENHLQGGDLHVTGCTFPGVFGVISGHNEHVAWGMSNGFPDVQDLYIEHLRRSDDGRIQYEFQDEWLDAWVIRELIGVRGQGTVAQDVVITGHGPIVNALAPDLAGEQPLALRWTAFEPETMGQTFYYMNRARNCRELHEALRYWTAPAQNFVYADVEGNIGYTYPGRLPIRAKGDGRVPVPGWKGEYEWMGYVPFEELPHLDNPPQGYVASANNRAVGRDYPYHVSCDYCSADRAQRISELIEARERIDLPYMRWMQLDQVSPGSRTVASYLGHLEVDDLELAVVVRLMRNWNGELAAGSPAAAVHEVLTPHLMRLLLSDRLGDLTARYMGLGINPLLADGSLLGFRAWEWLQTVLADPRSPWFDLGHGETRDDVLRLALRQAVEELKARCGPKIADWSWGKLHTLTYAHTFSQVKPLDRYFNRGPYPLGGDYTTVCATGGTQHHDMHGDAVIGPNFRHIADLGNLRRAEALLVPGQSGQPTSPHYDDQVQAWFNGQSHPMLFEREDVERAATARLQLAP